jgi:hypothetical protein
METIARPCHTKSSISNHAGTYGSCGRISRIMPALSRYSSVYHENGGLMSQVDCKLFRDFCSRFGLVRSRTKSTPFTDRPQRCSKPRKLNCFDSRFWKRVNKLRPKGGICIYGSPKVSANDRAPFPSHLRASYAKHARGPSVPGWGLLGDHTGAFFWRGELCVCCLVCFRPYFFFISENDLNILIVNTIKQVVIFDQIHKIF